MGHTSPRRWAQSHGADPIYIFVNTNRKNELSSVFRTLPHEISHAIGNVAEKFNLEYNSEPVAYSVGFVTEAFQIALLKELGYCVKKKEEE